MAITGYEIAGYIGTQPIDVPVAIPDVGEITINGDGSYTFTPAANYVGPIPVVTYTLADGNGGTDTSTLTLAMQGVNDVPVAGTLEDQGGWDSTSLEPYTVVAAFTDADGDALTFSLTGATPSWLTINPASGEILGTPPSDASQLSNMGQPGVYEVTVTATDPSGTTATAAYMLQIVNIPPVAYHDGEHDTPEGVGITLQVLDNDVDPDGDTIRVTGAESPDGKVTVNDDGSIYFEGTPGFVGWTTVTYDITDDQGGTSSASFDIHIDPAIVPDTPDAPEGPQQMVAIITPTEDVDGDILQTSQAIAETWQREETGRIEGVARSSSNAGFTGFSIRFGDSGLGANQQGSGLEVETMSDRFMLSLGFKPIEGGSLDRSGFEILMADGSPLPDWLEWRSSSLIQGRVPADIENLDLMIKQTLADGQTIINKWRVKTLTGEIINLGDRRTELPAGPTRQADQSFSDENVDLLHRALDAAE